MLYLQSTILSHSGDTEAAAHLGEAARRFDLSDRYLNRSVVCVRLIVINKLYKREEIKYWF